MAIPSAIMAITSAKQVVIPSATNKQKQNISCLTWCSNCYVAITLSK